MTILCLNKLTPLPQSNILCSHSQILKYSNTVDIPYNCHFFYTDTIFVRINLHPKTPIFRVKSVKNATFLRKICQKCQFFALSL